MAVVLLHQHIHGSSVLLFHCSDLLLAASFAIRHQPVLLLNQLNACIPFGQELLVVFLERQQRLLEIKRENVLNCILVVAADNLRRLLLYGLAGQSVEVLVRLFFFLLFDLLQQAVEGEVADHVLFRQLGHAQWAFVLQVYDFLNAFLKTNLN